MRGKLIVSGAMSVGHRITPADAGKTGLHCAAAKESEDHPRGCGENSHMQTVSPISSGITPADAGKTSAASIFTALFWDHPRGCGENGERGKKL